MREEILVTAVFDAACLARELATALRRLVAREGRGVGECEQTTLALAREYLGRVHLNVMLPEQLQLRKPLPEREGIMLRIYYFLNTYFTFYNTTSEHLTFSQTQVEIFNKKDLVKCGLFFILFYNLQLIYIGRI